MTKVEMVFGCDSKLVLVSFGGIFTLAVPAEGIESVGIGDYRSVHHDWSCGHGDVCAFRELDTVGKGQVRRCNTIECHWLMSDVDSPHRRDIMLGILT